MQLFTDNACFRSFQSDEFLYFSTDVKDGNGVIKKNVCVRVWMRGLYMTQMRTLESRKPQPLQTHKLQTLLRRSDQSVHLPVRISLRLALGSSCSNSSQDPRSGRISGTVVVMRNRSEGGTDKVHLSATCA